MWSDPEPDLRGWEESVRGAGILFGQDHTKKFLEKNNLVSVVRSHQMVDAGHESLWGGTFVSLYMIFLISFSCCLGSGLLHTVFSASYYGDANENKGAILIYYSDQESYKHPAEVVRPLSHLMGVAFSFMRLLLFQKSYHAENMVKTRAQRQQEQMNDTLGRIYERIFENRHALRLAFAPKANSVLYPPCFLLTIPISYFLMNLEWCRATDALGPRPPRCH